MSGRIRDHIEFASVHRRLGSRVTLIEAGTILGKDDPQAVDVIRRRFNDEGIGLIEQAQITAIEQAGKRAGG